MPQGDKSAYADKQKRQASATKEGHEQKGAARPSAEVRAWAKVNKLQGGGKKIGSGRKVPNGPVGGLGRKTNLARSS
jgi:hypothetical protein